MPTAAACSLYRRINFNKVLFHNSEDQFDLVVPPHFPNVHKWPGPCQNQVMAQEGEQLQNQPNFYTPKTLKRRQKIIISSL